MKKLSWRLVVMAVFAALAFCSGRTAVSAAEPDRGGPGERLDGIERRVNELAQRQEQLMRRLSTQPERPGQMQPPGPDGVQRPMQPPGPPGVPAPMLAKAAQDIAGLVRLAILVGIIFNILLAVWIYTDIRKRGEGSGIFVALALLAGIPATIIYALVRLGDKKT